MRFKTVKKSRESPGFFLIMYPYFKDCICTVKKGCKVLNSRFVKGVPFVNRRYTKEVPFPSKMVYKRVRGWTSGQHLPV